MKHNLLCVGAAAGAALVALFVRPGQSFDSRGPNQLAAGLASATVAQADAPAPNTTARTRTRRLPSYYGQVGLSTRQREAIYRLQESYAEQIEPLERRIELLKVKRDHEIENVLTPAQKQRLQQLLEAAAKRRASRADATAKADEKQP